MPFRDYKSKTIKINTSPFMSKVKGEIQSLIQQNQYDFHEQEAVEVTNVLLKEDNLPKNNGVKNYKYYGAIKGRWIENKQQSILPLGEIWILPLDSNIKRYPVIGENVVCVNHLGRTYYTTVVNINNNPNHNKLIGLSSTGKGTQEDINQIYEGGEKRHRQLNVKANPGDLVLQGRQGQSINLGSHQQVVSSIKMVAGHNPKNDYDITKDGASIYIQDGGTVRIKNPNPKYSDDIIGGKKIILDADHIVLNAKTSIKIQSGDETKLIGKVVDIAHNKDGQIFMGETEDFITNLEKKFLAELDRELNKCIDAFLSIIAPLQEDFEQIVELVEKAIEAPGRIKKLIKTFRQANYEPTVKFTEYDRLTKKFRKLNQELQDLNEKELPTNAPVDPVKRIRIMTEMAGVIRDLSNPENILRFNISLQN